MNKARLLFCGTPAFAVPSLKHLLAQPDFEIAAVIAQPDRPRGRGQQVSFSAVKEIALAKNVPVFQPEKIRSAEAEKFLHEARPDAIVIIAYGQIIPARLLGIPRLGWINLHASLLPKYRGAAPIQWAIASGETTTGVTTMRIDAGMDTGDILLQRETSIGSTETTPQLAQRLAELGAPLVAETLRGLRDATLKPKSQNHSDATAAPLLKKEDGRVDWSQPADTIYNRMRAFVSWPGSYTRFRGTTCHLLGEPLFGSTSTPGRAAVEALRTTSSSSAAPLERAACGTILFDGSNLLVACGQQSLLRITRVKMEGRNEVSALDFANGARLQPGETFA